MVLPFLYHNAFPFDNLNNLTFLGFIKIIIIIIIRMNKKNSNRSLSLKPPPDLTLLFNQFINAIPENSSDPENTIQSKYYDIVELQQLKIPSKEQALSCLIFIPAH